MGKIESLRSFSKRDSNHVSHHDAAFWTGAFFFHPNVRMNSISATLRCLLLGFSLIALQGLRVHAAEINVFAAASLSDVFKEIAADYQKETGDKLVFNFAASSTLARQIEEGAPADVFFSADEEKMDRLDKKNLIVKETRKSLLSNSLVIVVEKEGDLAISSPQDLATAKIKKLALAEPKTVPAGIYAKSHLQKLGLWDKVSDKVIPTENVRGALAAVEAGNVDAAIVYKTDALISKKVKVAHEIPAADGPDIRYPVAVIKEAKNLAAARRLAVHLSTPAASRTFEKFGFIVRPVTPSP